MKTKYFYLHGFNSASDPLSDKSKMLKTIGEVIHLNYDSFDSYDNIMAHLIKIVEGIDLGVDVAFVGTSLGGFYAGELADHFNYPCVLINPCLNPHTILNGKVGETFTNYKNGTVRVLEQDVVDSYKNKTFNEERFFHPLVLLDAGDELLNSYETAEYLGKYFVYLFEGGNHRFDHMEESLPLISNYSTTSLYTFKN